MEIVARSLPRAPLGLLRCSHVLLRCRSSPCLARSLGVEFNESFDHLSSSVQVPYLAGNVNVNRQTVSIEVAHTVGTLTYGLCDAVPRFSLEWFFIVHYLLFLLLFRSSLCLARSPQRRSPRVQLPFLLIRYPCKGLGQRHLWG